MRKSFLFYNVIFVLFLLVLYSSCGNKTQSNDQTEEPKKDTIRKVNFSVRNYNFAISENGKFIQYNKAIYHRGDEIFMVLSDVGSFERGDDSLNHAEMTMIVKDAVGQIISKRNNLFGKKGHGNFKNNILKSPYASYTSDSKDKPGKYSMCVIVYDLVKNDSIVIEDDFYIE